MKQIEKEELFTHLSGFLKKKGIELKEGSYAQSIHKGCSILADTINLSQQGIERAKTEIDKRLEQMRQVIHEKTAPKSQAAPPRAPKPSSPGAASKKPKAGKPAPARKAARKAPPGK